MTVNNFKKYKENYIISKEAEIKYNKIKPSVNKELEEYILQLRKKENVINNYFDFFQLSKNKDNQIVLGGNFSFDFVYKISQELDLKIIKYVGDFTIFEF